VYADWLDEHGEHDRAEFIRVQIEIAKFPGDPYSLPVAALEAGEVQTAGDGLRGVAAAEFVADEFKRLAKLRRREHDIHTANWSSWWPKEYDRIALKYRRGFPSEATCEWADWHAHAAALTWHPHEKRKCPETACPGLTVTLTDDIDTATILDSPTATRDDLARALRHFYPGVRRFVLPEPAEGVEEFVARMVREGRLMPVMAASAVAIGRGLSPTVYREWADQLSRVQPHPMFRERGGTWELSRETIQDHQTALQQRRTDRDEERALAHARDQRLTDYSD
jgi:hypothetical protein